MRDDRPVGVYVHVPFCRKRCSYCDFAVVPGRARRAPEFEDAVRRELGEFRRRRGVRCADTVHFGGGTPSHVDPSVIARLLDAVRAAFDVAPGAEVALEANVEDLEPAALTSWCGAGVTRLTVGVQALTDDGLRAIGRPASGANAAPALDLAAAAGFASLGADFIFGRPGQAALDWEREVEQIARLPLQHVSAYALETDGRTALTAGIAAGRVPAPVADDAAQMYESTVLALGAAGFERYEISNFARPGHWSRHNMKYWSDEPYAGFGPSAASYVDGERWVNPRRLEEYFAAAAGAAGGPEIEPYDPDRRAGEAIVFGLRRAAGVDLDAVADRHGAGPIGRRRPAIGRALRRGLAVAEGSRIRLADTAFLIADELFVDLL